MKSNPDFTTYANYIPLNKLFNEYIKDTISTDEDLSNLCKSDYHGCLFTVVSAKCESLIGITGICILETQYTFHLVTLQNELKIIPKKNVNFSFEINKNNKIEQFVIYGSQFQYRPADRATRKIKKTFFTEFT